MDVITITSGVQHPGKFASNFINSIRLSDSAYEVGLLKIACPPIANVTNDNNNLYIANNNSTMALKIPTGFYATAHDLAQSIFDTLIVHKNTERGIKTIAAEIGKILAEEEFEDANEEIDLVDTSAVLRYSTTGIADHSKLTLQLEDKLNKTCFIATDLLKGNVLKLLDFKINDFKAKTLTIHNYDLRRENQLVFIYSSIVSNSLIDDHVSRLLDTGVIKTTKNGEHCVFENLNPIFHDISASSFIDINFEIRDVHGNILEFQNTVPTILTLGIRKKQIAAI